MGLRDNSFAKIWSAKKGNGNSYSVNMSISRKDKETGEYKTQFSGFVNFAGEAAKKGAGLGLPATMDREHPQSRSIQIKGSPDVTTYYNPDQYKRLMAAANGNDELTKFVRSRANEKYITIWDFELADGSTPKPQQTAKKEEPQEEDELPF